MRFWWSKYLSEWAFGTKGDRNQVLLLTFCAIFERNNPLFPTMNALDSFYLNQEEPIKSCLLAMRDIILAHDPNIIHEWKYGMPFFCYCGKMVCYLWIHKKYGQPYLGIVEGKHFQQEFLLQEKRSRMKIMLLEPEKDLPIEVIQEILTQALKLHKSL